jgi:hypothetical protein
VKPRLREFRERGGNRGVAAAAPDAAAIRPPPARAGDCTIAIAHNLNAIRSNCTRMERKRYYRNGQGKEGGKASAAVKKANIAARRPVSATGAGEAAAADNAPDIAGGAAAAADHMLAGDGDGGAAAAADDYVPDVDGGGAAAAAEYEYDAGDFEPVQLAPAHAAGSAADAGDIQFAPFDPDAILNRVLDEHFAENAAASSSSASSIPLQSAPFVAASGQRIPLFDINSHANASGGSMHPSGFRRYTGLGPGFIHCHLHDSEIPCPPHLVQHAQHHSFVQLAACLHFASDNNSRVMR